MIAIEKVKRDASKLAGSLHDRHLTKELLAVYYDNVPAEAAKQPNPKPVRRQPFRPLWVSQVSETIRGFADKLPENWNSYQAKRTDQATAQAAIELLVEIVQPNTPRPEVVPTAAGGVQVEWHIHGIDLEINVRSQEQLGVAFEDLASGEEWSRECNFSDLGVIAQVVPKLSGQK
jgi:hypothetical protein